MLGLCEAVPPRRNTKMAHFGYPFLFSKTVPKLFSVLRSHDSAWKGERECKQGYWVFSRGILKSVIALTGLVMLLSVPLMYGSEILLLRANDLGRQCFNIKPTREQSAKKFKFVLVTCTDGSSAIRGRSFEGLMELVIPNKQNYVKRHGYDFVDASDLIDKSRPPSWSKILAVQKYLPNYDWVFWNDADSLVTNPAIALEDIINSITGGKEFERMPDLIVTEDVTGVNAGMFFVRNSTWSMQFLDRWWNQTSFIRPFGDCKSGDNDALKHLLKTMPKEERQQHVSIPKMQCLFNSNLWKPSLKSGHRLVTLTRTIWQGVYSKGDFMVHLAGLDNKKKWIQEILRVIEQEQTMSETSGLRN